MRDGAVAGSEVRARRRAAPAPTIRALAALVVLAAALVALTGGFGADGGASGARPAADPVEVLGRQATRPSANATRVPPPPVTPGAPGLPAATFGTPPPVPQPPVAAPVAAPGASCADALAYLVSHQAPGFTDVCADGSAFGHLGVTCVDQPGMCEGTRFVHIACPAPFVYMNEAHNTWTLTGAGTGIDPYGQGTDAQRAACAAHR